jgi:hypothetical protein
MARKRLALLIPTLLLCVTAVFYISTYQPTANRNGNAANPFVHEEISKFTPSAVKVRDRDESLVSQTSDNLVLGTSNSKPDTTSSLATQTSSCPPTATDCNGQPAYSCRGGGGGFALSLSFHDQQTWACGNLFSLQHWAGTVNMTVLEPFLVHTKLRFPKEIGPSDLPLSKLYNMEHWNEYGRKSGNAPTVPLECFLRHAPKKLILVYTNGFVGRCSQEEMRRESQLLTGSFGFKVVRDVCLGAKMGHRLSISEFSRRILGNFSSREVTVVFREWSQGTVGDILDMDSAHVPMALASELPLLPSESIMKDATEYISRYLKSKFVAILLRVEWLAMYSSMSTYNVTLLNCLQNTLEYVKIAKNKTNTHSVFLGLDIGRYGSVTIEPGKYEMARKVVEKNFFHSVFSDHDTTILEWEHTFEEVSQSTVPGYVALLQKSIAVQASCLLLIGSGSFQKQTLHRYMSLHSQRSRQCYLATESRCNVQKSTGFD